MMTRLLDASKLGTPLCIGDVLLSPALAAPSTDYIFLCAAGDDVPDALELISQRACAYRVENQEQDGVREDKEAEEVLPGEVGTTGDVIR